MVSWSRAVVAMTPQPSPSVSGSTTTSPPTVKAVKSLILICPELTYPEIRVP